MEGKGGIRPLSASNAGPLGERVGWWLWVGGSTGENQGWQDRLGSLRSATRHPERPRSGHDGGDDARVIPRPGTGPGPPGSAGSPQRLSAPQDQKLLRAPMLGHRL